MYEVHWHAYCCDFGPFGGTDECDTIREALAMYAMRTDPNGSDGPCDARLMVRSPKGWRRVGPNKRDRVGEIRDLVRHIGTLNTFAEMMRALDFASEIAHDIDEEETAKDRRFREMATRQLGAWLAS
jgi:hypothetical protein